MAEAPKLPFDPDLQSIDELNTAAWPLGTIDTRERFEIERDDQGHPVLDHHGKPRKVPLRTMTFSDTVVSKSGAVVERRWRMMANDLGLPTSQDEPVWLALLSLAWEQGLTDQTVRFTLRSLVQRCGWKPERKAYGRAKLALERLAGVTIYADLTWLDPTKGVPTTEAVHLIERATLVGTANNPPPENELEGFTYRRGHRLESSVKLSDDVWTSLRAAHHKPLALGTYLALKGPVARRLFRYLDLLRHQGQNEITLDLKALAYDRLGMPRTYAPSQIKRQLDPAHVELQDVGLLRTEPKYGAKGTVMYHLGTADVEIERLVGLLIDRGIKPPKVATDLVMAHRDRIEEHVEAYDRNGRARGPQLLRRAIEEGYLYSDTQLTRPRTRVKRGSRRVQPAQAAFEGFAAPERIVASPAPASVPSLRPPLVIEPPTEEELANYRAQAIARLEKRLATFNLPYTDEDVEASTREFAEKERKYKRA